MSSSMKAKTKLEGTSNYRAWKKRIYLILEKNKDLNQVQGKIKKPTDESSEAEKEKFRET